MPKVDADIGRVKCSYNAALDNTKVLVQAGETLVYNIIAHNTTAADAWIQLHNAAAITDVTLGTTVPVCSIPIAANEAKPLMHMTKPLSGFPLGLVIAATTAIAGGTSGACDVMVFYA
jgi:hypothetical protein